MVRRCMAQTHRVLWGFPILINNIVCALVLAAAALLLLRIPFTTSSPDQVQKPQNLSLWMSACGRKDTRGDTYRGSRHCLCVCWEMAASSSNIRSFSFVSYTLYSCCVPARNATWDTDVPRVRRVVDVRLCTNGIFRFRLSDKNKIKWII